MRYIRINEDNTIVYPYFISDLRSDYPNTSFPETITISVLNSFNVFNVNEVSKGDDYTKNYEEGIPELINGSYYQNWIITNATEEEVSQRINNKWSEVRSVRNLSLSDCDWTQLPDSPLSEIKKTEWTVYRQSLRDITNQQDPFNIIWPTKPQ